MFLPSRVICKVPGSTSNCGSGFDTLGLALSIYNEVLVERADATPSEKFGPDIFPQSSMAQKTVAMLFERFDAEPFEVKIRIRGDVPQARGLGSSVTVRGGILAGVAALAGIELDRETLVDLITQLEGHPDNASASVLGGFTVSRFTDSPAKVESVSQFPIEESLRFVVVSPAFEVLTSDSRGVLPETLSLSDVVKSINSASCVVAALSSGQYASLEGSVHDFIHEPYRLKGIPGAKGAIDAGIAAGAYTGWLSGSGSSVLCVCTQEMVTEVMAAMRHAFSAVALESVGYDLCADNEGLQILVSE